ATIEVNKMQIKFVTHGIDVTDQIDSVLLSPLDVGGLVNQPRYHEVRSKLLAQLLGPNSGGMHEICPPMIMRLGLVFLPLVEGDATDQDNPFALRHIGRRDGPREGESKNCSQWEESFRHNCRAALFMLPDRWRNSLCAGEKFTCLERSQLRRISDDG